MLIYQIKLYAGFGVNVGSEYAKKLQLSPSLQNTEENNNEWLGLSTVFRSLLLK